MLKGKESSRKESKRREHKGKSIFPRLVGTESTANCTGYKCEDAPAPLTTNGVFLGMSVDIGDLFENETFVCRNLNEYTSCMAVAGGLIFVGLKSSNQPQDLFDFSSGPGTIAVFNTELREITRLSFDYGFPVQLTTTNDSLVTVLFNSGTLGSFTFKNASGVLLTDFKVILDNKQIIKFSRYDNVIVFTDGYRMYRYASGDLVTSKCTAFPIIDLFVAKVANEEVIVGLNRNGCIFSSDSKFEKTREITANSAFYKLLPVTDYGFFLILECHDMKIRVYKLADIRLKVRKMKFILEDNGSVTICRCFSSRTKFKKIFQVVNSEKGILFCAHGEEFDEYRNCQMHLTGIHDFSNFFILSTENGLLLKVFYI